MVKNFLFCLIIFFSLVAQADEPPSWENFTIISLDRSHVAKVERKFENSKEFTLTIYRVENNKKLWSVDYKYDGYPGGILSKDGSTFVYVNDWFYKELPVISIYQNGKLKKEIKGEALKISKKNIIPTTSHYRWLDDSHRFEFIEKKDKFKLIVHALGDNQIIIDLKKL